MAKWWPWPRRSTAGERPELSPVEGYRRWAADYGREPNAFQQLEAAALERLLPDVGGLRVLDLGCGRGRLSRQVLERGAEGAVAADLTLAMLTGAGAYSGPRLVAPAGGPLPFRRGAFDLVVFGLVLGHVEDLDRAMASMAAVLAPGGHLLISDFHPYATLRGWQRTFVDPERGDTRAIVQHLHMLSDYVRALRREGLAIEALEEPLWQGSPVAFVLRARKPERRSRDAVRRQVEADQERMVSKTSPREAPS